MNFPPVCSCPVAAGKRANRRTATDQARQASQQVSQPGGTGMNLWTASGGIVAPAARLTGAEQREKSSKAQ